MRTVFGYSTYLTVVHLDSGTMVHQVIGKLVDKRRPKAGRQTPERHDGALVPTRPSHRLIKPDETVVLLAEGTSKTSLGPSGAVVRQYGCTDDVLDEVWLVGDGYARQVPVGAVPRLGVGLGKLGRLDDPVRQRLALRGLMTNSRCVRLLRLVEGALPAGGGLGRCVVVVGQLHWRTAC